MSSVISDTSDIQKVKRGRKESHVWDHFTKESLGSGHYSAKCHYCAQTWSKGKPEVLKGHLALKCNEAPLNVKTEYMEALATGTTSTNRKQNTNVDFHDSSAEIDINKKDKIDQSLIRFFVVVVFHFQLSTIHILWILFKAFVLAIILQKEQLFQQLF